jgi:hypothetical protein
MKNIESRISCCTVEQPAADRVKWEMNTLITEANEIDKYNYEIGKYNHDWWLLDDFPVDCFLTLENVRDVRNNAVKLQVVEPRRDYAEVTEH